MNMYRYKESESFPYIVIKIWSVNYEKKKNDMDFNDLLSDMHDVILRYGKCQNESNRS